MDDPLQYEGARVVVTGAASGMGAACAAALTELGAEVHGIDINDGGGGLAAFHRCDLGDPASIDATVAEIGGSVDSLFNCAGLPTTAPSQKIVLVNFVGHRHLTEALIPHMGPGSSIGFISSAAGMGWIMNMANLYGLLMTPDFEAAQAWCADNAVLIGENGYGFSKEAINAYAAFRGFQLAPEGIRVNAIMPGPTDTPMMPSFVESMGRGVLPGVPQAGRTELDARGAGLAAHHAQQQAFELRHRDDVDDRWRVLRWYLHRWHRPVGADAAGLRPVAQATGVRGWRPRPSSPRGRPSRGRRPAAPVPCARRAPGTG